MNEHMRMNDGLLSEQRAMTAAARAKARHAASRQTERERGAIPIPVPRNATPRQAASIRAVAAEIAVREAASRIARGWERASLRMAPQGAAPVAMLMGRARLVRVAVDEAGTLRLIEPGGDLGSAVTISEACAMAARR